MQPNETPEDVNGALQRAYSYLGRRDRTVSEMVHYLREKGFSEAVVAEAVAELETQGYLNDEQFAERFTEDRTTIDGWGRERIRRRLIELGVSREIVEAAVELTGDSELERAVELLRQRFPNGLEDNRERQRALGLLVRRGFESELAYEAINSCSRNTF